MQLAIASITNFYCVTFSFLPGTLQTDRHDRMEGSRFWMVLIQQPFPGKQQYLSHFQESHVSRHLWKDRFRTHEPHEKYPKERHGPWGIYGHDPVGRFCNRIWFVFTRNHSILFKDVQLESLNFRLLPQSFFDQVVSETCFQLREMVCCKRTPCTWKMAFRGACIGVVLSAWSAIIAGGGAEAWSFISKRGFALHPVQGAFLNRPGKLHAIYIDTKTIKNICIYIYTIVYLHTLLCSTLSYHTMTIPCPYTMTIPCPYTMPIYHDQIP